MRARLQVAESARAASAFSVTEKEVVVSSKVCNVKAESAVDTVVQMSQKTESRLSVASEKKLSGEFSTTTVAERRKKEVLAKNAELKSVERRVERRIHRNDDLGKVQDDVKMTTSRELVEKGKNALAEARPTQWAENGFFLLYSIHVCFHYFQLFSSIFQ